MSHPEEHGSTMPSPKDLNVPSEEHMNREKTEKKEKRKSKSGRSERNEDGSRVHRHKSSRKSKLSSTADSDSHSSHSRRHRKGKGRDPDEFSELPAPSSVTDLVPELMSRAGSSFPYPSFSKTHSKECVRSKEDVSTSRSHRTDPLTPDATDLGGGGGGDEKRKKRPSSSRRRSKSVDHASTTSRKPSSSLNKDARPPTPPETDLSKQQAGGSGVADSTLESRLDSTLESKLEDDDHRRSTLSGMSKSTARDSKSRVSAKSYKSKASSQATFKASAAHPPMPGIAVVEDGDSILSDSRTATSVAMRQKSSSRSSTSGKVKKKKRRPKPDEGEEQQSPESAPDSSPKTPTVNIPPFPPPPPPPMSHDKMPAYDIPFHSPSFHMPPMPPPMPSQTPMTDMTGFSAATGFTTTTGFSAAPPPPPPPPPALNIQEAPRVDYLLANGGLPLPAPRTFLSVIPRYNSTRPTNPPLTGCETLFSPFFNLLEQYQSVLNKHGSIAVATGHRTVARRLLDRLENVFSRDLSPAGCSCVMCDSDELDHRGLGWGEVLERVSGRGDLPPWPPFDISTLGSKPEDNSDLPPRASSPINLDPDIAPEFRDHYIRQTKKVKASVDKWLTKNEEQAPLPQDIDDDTLAFTILTSLEKEDRPYFNALLAGSRELQPALRAPTPMKRPRIDFIVKCGLSIQRLYRLSQVPRDAETALFLVRHPEIHDLILTISDINPSEWEILTSGRFDGFLWSGAEDEVLTPTADNPSRGATPAFPPSRGVTPANVRIPSAMGSRTTTPFGPYSRGPTPASFVSMASTNATNRAAVSNDEETELAVLAEVEREIYQGMEKLEDAFEKLHHRAEVVRTALRNRGAALSMSLQQRRGGYYNGSGPGGNNMGGGPGGSAGIDIMPGSGNSMYSNYERPPWAPSTDEDGSESDWGGDDFEIRPDDSASNVASNRHRKAKRRDERRTPAPIAEDEDEA